MKSILKILRSPLTLIILFSFLIISGKSSSMFYIILVVMGLTIPTIHSILGIIGIAVLLFSLLIEGRKWRVILRLVGALCLIASLIRFFTQPGGDYNYNTLVESVPLILLVVFLLLVITFIGNQLSYFFHRESLS